MKREKKKNKGKPKKDKPDIYDSDTSLTQQDLIKLKPRLGPTYFNK